MSDPGNTQGQQDHTGGCIHPLQWWWCSALHFWLFALACFPLLFVVHPTLFIVVVILSSGPGCPSSPCPHCSCSNCCPVHRPLCDAVLVLVLVLGHRWQALISCPLLPISTSQAVAHGSGWVCCGGGWWPCGPPCCLACSFHWIILCQRQVIGELGWSLALGCTVPVSWGWGVSVTWYGLEVCTLGGIPLHRSSIISLPF